MEQNQITDDRCHQCKAHGATELELNDGFYSVKSLLCSIHAAEMKDHFGKLQQRQKSEQ